MRALSAVKPCLYIDFQGSGTSVNALGPLVFFSPFWTFGLISIYNFTWQMGVGRQRRVNSSQFVLLVISSPAEKSAEDGKYIETPTQNVVYRIFSGFLLIKTVSFCRTMCN